MVGQETHLELVYDGKVIETYKEIEVLIYAIKKYKY